MSRYNWKMDNPDIAKLEQAVEAARKRVVGHPVYGSLDSLGAVVTFMEHHVFAVWDFMSLLKSLQQQLTCPNVPWIPTGSTTGRRLINDIVLVEESDEIGDGFISHFELYLRGMQEAGADTAPVEKLVALLHEGRPVLSSLAEAGAPAPSVEFATATWEFIEKAPVHCQAAAFAFGREDLIPDMFDQVVAVNRNEGSRLGSFVDYLERHIEVDGEEHTPMAMQMLADLCGDDQDKWRECEEAVHTALNARVRLWDGVYQAIRG